MGREEKEGVTGKSGESKSPINVVKRGPLEGTSPRVHCGQCQSSKVG